MLNNSRRKERDMMKLMMSNYKVELLHENQISEFTVMFNGPKETPYEDGVWKLRVSLPAEYPFKSPSIGFVNRIYHPNIDAASGSICLDVINQTWSPMFDLLNIFDVFIPQLLTYPNGADPLNHEAAALLARSPAEYNKKVRDYVRQYASKGSIISASANGNQTHLNGYTSDMLSTTAMEDDRSKVNDAANDIDELSEISDIDD